jgi:GDPmannose 4,6-dehydratase
MKNKKAIIVGINGQDGSYLAEYLLSKEYSIYVFVNKKKKFFF